jgi:predicted SPOUT superfamily RNA methylase MTH1
LQPIYETGNASILPHHQALDASLPSPSPNGLIYRHGVTLKAQEPAPSYRRYVNAGLEQLCTIAEPYPKSTRITLAIEPEEYENAIEKGRRIQASVVEPESAPREEAGVYTGFTIRRALGYSGMFEECPYAGGYDLNLAFSNFEEGGQDASALDTRENEGFKHLLIVVGEEEKLDGVLARDGKLKDMGIKVTELFDLPLNTPKEVSVEDMLKEGLEHVQKLIKTMK